MSEHPPTEFPSSIGKVANRELALNGYTTFDSLTKVSAKELLKIHGIGFVVAKPFSSTELLREVAAALAGQPRI